MFFSILLLLKIILFMNITKIQYNQSLIFLTSTLVTMFIFTSIYFSNYKKKRVLGLSIYTFISLVMFMDVMYYSHFNILPSANMLSLLGQVGAVGDSIAVLFSFKNALFILDIPLLIIYLIKTNNKREQKTYNRHIRWGVPGCIAILLIILLLFLNTKDLLIPVSNQELFTYHIKDIKDAITKKGVVEGRSLVTLEDLEKLKDRSQMIEGKYTGTGKGKNLIVIQVEALQNFPINRFYDGQEITPNLNKLIEEQGSLYFNNYYQQIGRGNTSDAEFVTNNSLYPSDQGSIYKTYEKNTFYGLPWILRDNGYTSWVFHGYEKEFWNRENAYVNQGFQRFVSEEDYEFSEDETIGFGIIDEV
ncbi:sulfatase-like hydrolase/transferase, partial [Schnuerera sp. xch1]|uniref:LTA synthase family protein n=1 Tax=Schnuerera sp. xch1 TaxID=2874283 RepID=UPI001CBC7F5A